MTDNKRVTETDSLESGIESLIHSYYNLTPEIRKRVLSLVDYIQDTQLFN